MSDSSDDPEVRDVTELAGLERRGMSRNRAQHILIVVAILIVLGLGAWFLFRT